MRSQDLYEGEDWYDEEDAEEWHGQRIKGVRREKQKSTMKMSGKGLKDTERVIGERARRER